MLGNLNDSPIGEVLNNSVAKEIRASLKQGKAHKYCKNCVSSGPDGGEKQWHNTNSPDINYQTVGDEYEYPVIVDARWNITCNLSCNYCEEACSSKWASIKGIPVKTEARHYYNDVCQLIEHQQEHIRDVALVGGEPLLLPENERLLDVIPPAAAITIITNLSTNLETNKIFKKLQARQKVGWSLSFDNVGERFEYVRYGAKWEQLKHNLQLINELKETQGHWGGIHAVYSLYNATRLCELAEFAHENNTTIRWQQLFHPQPLDPYLHGPRVAELAVKEIEKFYSTGLATPSDKQFFDSALQLYSNSKTIRNNVDNRFQTYIDDIENKYHTDTKGQFVALWPELAHLCK